MLPYRIKKKKKNGHIAVAILGVNTHNRMYGFRDTWSGMQNSVNTLVVAWPPSRKLAFTMLSSYYAIQIGVAGVVHWVPIPTGMCEYAIEDNGSLEGHRMQCI